MQKLLELLYKGLIYLDIIVFRYFFLKFFKNVFKPNAPSIINTTSISDLYLGLPMPIAGVIITKIKLIKVKI